MTWGPLLAMVCMMVTLLAANHYVVEAQRRAARAEDVVYAARQVVRSWAGCYAPTASEEFLKVMVRVYDRADQHKGADGGTE